MTTPRILLYVDSRFTSPYAMSAFVTLQEKALPFEIETVDLAAQQNHAPGYATVSLTCRVPTLVCDDFTLSESSAISEYLDEQFPAPDYAAVYPVDGRLRARARQIQAWLRSDFLALRQERSTETVFYKPTLTPLSGEAGASAARLFAAVGTLLPEGAWNLFGSWCIADVDLAVMLQRLLMNGDAVPDRLAAYARHQWQRPAVQSWIKQIARARRAP